MEKNKKEGRYQRIFLQLGDLLQKSENDIAKMATISAVLFNKFEYFFWCGFYRIVDGELIVGPYQGPVACQVLQKNKGVCWAGINQKETILVPNVEEFPGHIACDSRSKSEIVIPVKNKSGEIFAVLDVDSKELNSFDEIDKIYLEKIINLISN
ncbi:MAG: GAF domain-containing protein [Bacteroidetes bacterium]|nr:GAF domain-containing protein [Bacteroidota bacterium]